MTPDHIKRIIERLDPVDREALEQHLKDESIMGQLMCLQEIRQAIGDPHSKLMQEEVVDKTKGLVQQNASLKASFQELQALRNRSGVDLDCALRGTVREGAWQPDSRLASVAALSQEVEKLRQALEQCAEKFRSYAHYHAAKPDHSKAVANMEMAWMAEAAIRAGAPQKGHPDAGVCSGCCGYGCDDAGDMCERCEGGGHEPTEDEQ